MITTEKLAKYWAIRCHAAANHIYGDHLPYSYHLQMAATFAKKYLDIIPEEDRVAVISAAWCHDTIEDARQTYNDVKKVIGEKAADIVYAVTNEKGKTREERANDKYYNEMKLVPNAVFVKLCDRLANATYSRETNSSMINKYRKEQPHFEEMLYDERYKDMFDELNEILN